MGAQREICGKISRKVVNFELQESFLHILGVSQNFQFNGEHYVYRFIFQLALGFVGAKIVK